MRQGFDAQLVFSKSGNLVAFATGSDATTEHEIGIKPLLSCMTQGPGNEDELVRKLKSPLLRRFVRYPDLLEAKRIVNLPPQYQFIVTNTTAGPEAWLGVANQPLTQWERELPLHERFSKFSDPNVVGAYDDRSFALRVRGDKYVKALKQFDAALRAGDGVFAGTFFERPKLHLRGLLLANRKFLSDEDKAAIAKAQAKWESGLRLAARDDSRQLYQQLLEVSGRRHIGYLWAKWADPEESGVVYGLNPDHDTPADYLGPYTREQLLDWARARLAYRLSPLPRAA